MLDENIFLKKYVMFKQLKVYETKTINNLFKLHMNA